MPAVQTSYTTSLRPAFAGMKADMTPETILSRVVEGAGGLPFGFVAVKGTGDRQVKAAAGGTAYIGISLVDQTAAPAVPPTTVDQYQAGDVAAIMIKGTVWVVAGATVAAQDPVYYVPATGVLTNSSSGNTLIPNAVWETSAASSALAIIRLK